MIIEPAPKTLLRLMTWLSPAFPIGGFSYSHGLEAAIVNDRVSNKEELRDWLAALISHGSIWNDCVFLALSIRSKTGTGIVEIAELAEAMAGSKERHMETMSQGRSFLIAAHNWIPPDMSSNDTMPLPVALGAVARYHEIDAENAIIAYLQSFISNQIQAALRLMTIGQTNGLWVQIELESEILTVAKRAECSSTDDLGGNTFIAEISAMQHETLQSRIFKT